MNYFKAYLENEPVACCWLGSRGFVIDFKTNLLPVAGSYLGAPTCIILQQIPKNCKKLHQVAPICNKFQQFAICCYLCGNIWQQVATGENRSQHVATGGKMWQPLFYTYCTKLHHIETDCNRLQQIVTYCNKVQQIAINCNILQ